MTISSSFFFASKLIFPKSLKNSTARKSVIGAIICIALSIIPLVIVMSVSDGMVQGMTERIIELSTSHLKVFIRNNSKITNSIADYKDFSKKFYNVSGVKAVYPEMSFSCLASGNSYRTGALVRGVDCNIFTENKSFATLFNINQGSLENFSSNKNNVVIGTQIATLLNLKIGDNIHLISTRKVNNNMIVPKVSVFKVCAIVSSGYQELDSLWIFMPIEKVIQCCQKQSIDYAYLIQTEDAFSSDLLRIKRDCSKIAKSNGFIYRWNELNVSQFQNFSSTKLMLFLVMILILLIASINISSAIIMLVMERRKEIAILKSIGGSPKGISLSFIIAGLFCGLSGFIIGLPFGLICSININKIIYFLELCVNFFGKLSYCIQGHDISSYISTHLMDPAFYLTEIPVMISIEKILFIFIIVLVLSFLVSIIPSLKAGKEKPLDIFRKA